MVTFYRPAHSNKRAKNNVKNPRVAAAIMGEWDTQGKAIVRERIPVTFVEGALPGEVADIQILSTHASYHSAKVTRIQRPHPQRVDPFCAVYEQCGGCQLQHVPRAEALEWRQRALETQLQRALKLTHVPWQPVLRGQANAYRRSARLAIDARDPQAFKCGFRQPQSNAVVDIDTCPVLVPALDTLLSPLKTLLAQLPGHQHIGHVQLLAGDNLSQVNVHVTRTLPASSYQQLAVFAGAQAINMTVTSPSAAPVVLHHQGDVRCYTSAELYLSPGVNDFVQVNAEVNHMMVQQAMQWLAPQPSDNVLDLFAGIGNFSLSLAASGAHVVAVEGVAEMVQAARSNAQQQGIDSIDWQCADLNDPHVIAALISSKITKVLLDPSREGAFALSKALAQSKVESILYVSCNPATFMRDAQQLMAGRFELVQLGLIEMFPFTRHLELMALFVPRKKPNGR